MSTRRIALVLVLLVVAVTALKRSNVGKNEWSKQNIGKITSMQDGSFQFYSEKGIYGDINPITGELKRKWELEPGYKFLG